MRQLNKWQTIVFMLGGMGMVVGAGMFALQFAQQWACWIFLAGALALSQCDLKDHLWKVRGESLKVCYHATPVPSDIADVKHNSWIKSAVFTEILPFPRNQILGTAQAFNPVSKDC